MAEIPSKVLSPSELDVEISRDRLHGDVGARAPSVGILFPQKADHERTYSPDERLGNESVLTLCSGAMYMS